MKIDETNGYNYAVKMEDEWQRGYDKTSSLQVDIDKYYMYIDKILVQAESLCNNPKELWNSIEEQYNYEPLDFKEYNQMEAIYTARYLLNEYKGINNECFVMDNDSYIDCFFTYNEENYPSGMSVVSDYGKEAITLKFDKDQYDKCKTICDKTAEIISRSRYSEQYEILSKVEGEREIEIGDKTALIEKNGRYVTKITIDYISGNVEALCSDNRQEMKGVVDLPTEQINLLRNDMSLNRIAEEFNLYKSANKNDEILQSIITKEIGRLTDEKNENSITKSQAKAMFEPNTQTHSSFTQQFTQKM